MSVTRHTRSAPQPCHFAALLADMEHIADSIRAGDVRAVQQAVNELLDRNAQPPLTPDGKTWLHVACEAGEANIVQLLLAHDGMFAVVDQDASELR